ncbi:MAG: hypothetical protein IJV58_09030 [Oscillospiraceae bacterium]|nr:hypothetical protein [Oscillospiraceae bacterium]MBR1458103.1 hypothetical protein [Oscillospiraceae bacterium]
MKSHLHVTRNLPSATLPEIIKNNQGEHSPRRETEDDYEKSNRNDGFAIEIANVVVKNSEKSARL